MSEPIPLAAVPEAARDALLRLRAPRLKPRSLWPEPTPVVVPTSVPPLVGARAWAMAFAIETASLAVKYSDVRGLEAADEAIATIRDELRALGYELAVSSGVRSVIGQYTVVPVESEVEA